MKEKTLRRYIRECILMEKLSDEFLRQRAEDDAKFASKFPERAKERSFGNLSKDPKNLTGTNIANISSGNNLSSLITIFDDIEDYIKSTDSESLKQITLDLPKKQTKEILNNFKDKLTTFAQGLKQNSKVTTQDSKSYKNAGYNLENLIDSTFKTIMADKG